MLQFCNCRTQVRCLKMYFARWLKVQGRLEPQVRSSIMDQLLRYWALHWAILSLPLLLMKLCIYIERSEVTNWQRRIVSITWTHCISIDIRREIYSINTSFISYHEPRIERDYIAIHFFVQCSVMFFNFYHDRLDRKRVPDQRVTERKAVRYEYNHVTNELAIAIRHTIWIPASTSDLRCLWWHWQGRVWLILIRHTQTQTVIPSLEKICIIWMSDR